MSDILIKGMEMPNNCTNCAARHGAECWLANCSYIPNYHKKRPKWCPLVPVPTHGRLIDKDAIILEDGPYEYDEWCEWALGQYQDAPVIISASEEVNK